MIRRSIISIAFLALTACGGSPTYQPRSPGVSPAAYGVISNTSDARSALDAHFHAWQGTPHRLGGLARSGIDCSGFVYVTYRDVYGMTLPRATRSQAYVGRDIHSNDLKHGDLVFFRIGVNKRHVGVYVGDGQFIHASASRGVTKSSLASKYWRNAYWKSVRVLAL